jgi:hypothetical protein
MPGKKGGGKCRGKMGEMRRENEGEMGKKMKKGDAGKNNSWLCVFLMV